jgi:hypothetical protein
VTGLERSGKFAIHDTASTVQVAEAQLQICGNPAPATLGIFPRSAVVQSAGVTSVF